MECQHFHTHYCYFGLSLKMYEFFIYCDDCQGSLEANSGNAVPPVYITKYNRFVDNILERINKILRKNYEPVNVRLHNNNNNKKKNTNKNNNNKKKNKNRNRRRRPNANKKGNGRTGYRSEDIARSTT